ncbi:MAG: type II toxin-antitoxin system VapC family toxin [Leptolyngbya sp. Prado105]|jgi:PIN domain nuclease of toxin-antitoxin system|nr:type II toxin-antitoxin system VapC family toxin [Leptolyngbya sp. Prado105]
MRILLDTHAFLWFDAEPDRLSNRCKNLLRDENNLFFLSVASVWEIQIKSQLGKLALRLPLPSLIADQEDNLGLQILQITPSHVYALQNLPDIHRDPFDRIMIAQARMEDLPFVSNDSVFRGYPIQQVW